jgi:PEGA domain-containing protein
MRKIGLLLACGLVAGCATIIHGGSQDVGISTSPAGAKVTVDNQSTAITPFVAKLTRKDDHTIRLQLDGYQPAEVRLTKSMSGWVWGNIVFGGVVGIAIDAVTGAMYSLRPDQVQSALQHQSAQIAPTKDGIYVVLVKHVDPAWVKVGQLERAPTTVAN